MITKPEGRSLWSNPWLAAAVFLVGILVALILLASGAIPGMPDAQLKNVTVYSSPRMDKSPLAVFFQPPMSVLEVDGAKQPVAVQFTNNSAKNVGVEHLTLEGGCLQLQLEKGEQEVDHLAPGESRTGFYELGVAGAGDECLGRHPIAIRYTFTFATDESNGKSTVQGLLSTSPILVTKRTRLKFERFFHVAGTTLAIPLLLAVATFLLQRFQERSADQKKDNELLRLEEAAKQEQKLKVWQTVFPVLDGYSRQHYTPILRQISVVRQEISLKDAEGILTSLLVLRARFDKLSREVGGYYFRHLKAEDLCAITMEGFFELSRELSGDRDEFSKLVQAMAIDALLVDNKVRLKRLQRDPKIQMFILNFQQELIVGDHCRKLDRYLSLAEQVMAFEASALFYPEWYEVAPSIDLASFIPNGLGFDEVMEKDWEAILTDYKWELRHFPKGRVT